MFQANPVSIRQTITLAQFITFFILITTTCSAVVDTIAMNQIFKDGETIASENETFELGFFSPGSSKNRYLGIWYKNMSQRTVVWVANRENPLTSTTGVFMFSREQVFLLQSDNGTIVWSSNFSVPILNTTPMALLLDTGNFIIRDSSNTVYKNLIWQSFDYPGNTLLPGMKFGKDFKTGRTTYLTSWSTKDDPSPGEYSLKWILDEYPQLYMIKGSTIEIRFGPWNGVEYAGLPHFESPFYTYKHEYIVNPNEWYYLFTFNSTTFVQRDVLTEDGRCQLWHHVTGTPEWMQDQALPLDVCDRYGLCGPYGSCNTAKYPLCGCLEGFETTQEWRPEFWTAGCQPKVPLDCGPKEGFVKMTGVKLPDTKGSWFSEHMNLKDCERACKKNCSCTAYANPYIKRESACLLWFGDLIDVRVYSQNGQDLYIRMAASELSELQHASNRKRQLMITLLLPTTIVFVAFCFILAKFASRKSLQKSNVDKEGTMIQLISIDANESNNMENMQLSLFSLSKVAWATSNFSDENKLGEGGFGSVYKGVLEDGKEVAVKRLAHLSHQGLEEFKNEVICIAKLQHRNLVKLLGYCFQGEEKLLIYEYLPNKSLDGFIFGDRMNVVLDWPQRFHIIHGIARGLLYLHQDSHLRIVHRDLKASNILLDVDMNPKISDFGLARIFKGQESEAKTQKVVGTLGYISPEYAVRGQFSLKSDVFSFGVLVLEIVSGKRNSDFSYVDCSDNLLGHAWKLNREGESLSFVDASLGESLVVYEALRSMHIGLLCVQQEIEDRPSMSSVVVMLGSDGLLPSPKHPGFFNGGSDSALITPPIPSTNGLTWTQVNGR